jgi:hypothetical protein
LLRVAGDLNYRGDLEPMLEGDLAFNVVGDLDFKIKGFILRIL